MLRQGAKRRHRQEQQGADYKNRTQEQERERRGVVPEGSCPDGTGLLFTQETRHRDHRDDRKEAADGDDDRCSYVPCHRLGSRVRVVVEAIGDAQAVECRAVIRRGRRELVHDL